MRILSVFQPWAGCVFLAGRTTHSLPFSTSYRGTLGIFASSMLAESRQAIKAPLGEGVAWQIGAVIGTVDLVGTSRHSQSAWAVPGLVHWEFEVPRLFEEPVLCEPQIGLWTPDRELMKDLALFV